MKTCKTLFLFLVLTATALADWYVTLETIPDISLQARVLKEQIYCQLKSPQGVNGKLYMFYSIGKPLKTVTDLQNAELWLVTNTANGYFQLDPPQNGRYYFMGALMVGTKDKLSKFVMIQCSNFVTIQGKTNIYDHIPKPLGWDGSTTLLNPGARGMSNNLNEPTAEELERLNRFINEIREFHLEIRTKYFAKEKYDNLDIYDFLIRYTSITSELDAIYLNFIMKSYNWKYIPAVNKEYTALTQSVLETYKKIVKHLKEEVMY